jgi:hypothetical protein
MNESPLHKLRLNLETWRLRQHFKRAESILRAQDVSHLPLPIQRAREHYLDHLHAYAARGIFPRNYERPLYAPCFIDRDAHECAVAHLVIVSGHAAAAHKIATLANYAYVPQMNFPELDEWATQAGFTKDELALIQPGYPLTFDGPLLTLAVVTWTAGILAFVINAVQFMRRRKAFFIPEIEFTLVTVLLLVSFLCFAGAWYDYFPGTNSDIPQGFRDIYLREAGNFALGGIASLGIALLTGGLGYYRLRAYLRLKDSLSKQSADEDAQSKETEA